MAGQGQRDAAIALKDTFGEAADKVSSKAGDFHGQTADNVLKGAQNLSDADGELTNDFNKLGDGKPTTPTPKPGGDTTPPPEGTGTEPNGSVDDNFKDPGSGQGTDGNNGTTTGGTDPVDVVSGQMITAKADVALAGVLPLVLRRAYASGYRHGALFGAGWSSTLDQRLVIDDDGIHVLGDDAQQLDYGVPTQPGQQVLPAAGARWPLAWDRTLDTITVHDPESGFTWVFPPPPRNAVPEARGRQTRHLTRLTDRNGNWLSIARDADGVPTEVGHVGGYHVAVDSSYCANGFRVEGLRLLDGSNQGQGTALLGYRYDPAGRLVEITDSTGVPYVYEYDADDRITAWIDRSGYRYEYVYDEFGRVVRAAGHDGLLSSELAYDPDARVTTVTNSLGETSEYHYDEHHHVTKRVDPSGHTSVTETDRYGRLLSFADALGNTTQYVRDANGGLAEIRRADGTSLAFQNDGQRLVGSTTAPDGSVWRYDYDERGNCTSITDPLGAVTGYAYDDHGARIAHTDALGYTTRIECDRAGLPTALVGETGERAEIERDAFGRVVVERHPLGGVTRTEWTVEGLPLWREGADGLRDEWVRDARGDVVERRESTGRRVRYELGSLGRMTARTDPDDRRYEFRYDTECRVTEVVNPSGLCWRYQYDATGRISEETDFNGRTVAYRYDAAGRISARFSAGAPETTYRCDALGQVVETRTGDEAVRYEIDPCGRLIGAASATSELRIERDATGRVLSETVNGRTLKNEYDARGSRIRRTTPGGAVSEWTFDAYGLPTAFASAAGSLAFEHDADGRESTRYLGDRAALTQSFDAAGRLTGQSVWAHEPGHGSAASGSDYRPLQQRTYAYRGDGHLVAVDDALSGNREYDLDPFGRVTSVTAANWTERYAYDAAGMIGDADLTGADEYSDILGPRTMSGTLVRQAARTSYEHDERGRVVRIVRRTLSGQRRVWEFAWNDLNRLTSVSNPDAEHWRYGYDPLGRRTAKQQLSDDGRILRQVLFTWDDSRVVEQEAGAPGERPHVTSWDYQPGTMVPVAQTEKRPALTEPLEDQEQWDLRFFAIVTDLIGSPSELVDTSGSVAWHRTATLWGLPLGGGSHGSADGGDGVRCPLRFPGQYYDDESSWHYNLYRYYDPAVGRYASPDPLGLEPAPDNYGYVPNPCASSDPLGLSPDPGPITSPDRMIAYAPHHTTPFNMNKKVYYPPSDGPYVSKIMPPGTKFNVVVNAPKPGEGPSKPGGFGTFDKVPDRDYLHNQLSVLPDWKPNPQVGEFEIPDDGKPFRVQTSKVGPLINPFTGEMLAPGGGTQIQFLSDSGRLIPTKDPVDLPC